MIIIKKVIKTSLKVLILFIITAILSLGGLYLYAYLTPKITIKTNGKYYIYDQNDNLVYQGSGVTEWVNIEDINKNMLDAIVSAEDKNFYKHQGLDYIRIIGAMKYNIENNGLYEGASTISQQYVKNMYLTFDKTWKRKLEEALLTLELEVHYTKDQILEGYLNTINFGQGNFGIGDASKFYFNKSASELTLEEACILAGIPKSPDYFNPIYDYDASIYRAKLVAKSMVKNNIITEEKYNSLFKNKIEIYGKRESNNLTTLMYYQDAVLQELSSIENIPNSIIDAGGLKIYTELDIDKQTILENAINANMGEDGVQVASVYVDPETGGVKALVGGKNYNYSQFNRVTMSKRQVGSTIKPFLYYAALANGFTSASVFRSEPTTFNLSNNQTYTPTNFANIYANSPITMASALAYSDNVFAVKTHLFLGEETLVDTMKLFGLKEKLSPIPSLALGTNEINMLDYAKAYTALASGGYEREIHLIKKVEDINGNLLYERNNNDSLILNYNYVYIINEMLTNTYNPEFISYNNPTAILLKGRLSRKYSIKTGTTDTDNWIVGYNKDALLMVWTGNDNNEQTYGYSQVTKNIWGDTIEECLKNEESTWYEKPTNVIGIPLEPITGNFVTTGKSTIFYFIKGSEPKYYISNTN